MSKDVEKLAQRGFAAKWDADVELGALDRAVPLLPKVRRGAGCQPAGPRFVSAFH